MDFARAHARVHDMKTLWILLVVWNITYKGVLRDRMRTYSRQNTQMILADLELAVRTGGERRGKKLHHLPTETYAPEPKQQVLHFVLVQSDKSVHRTWRPCPNLS